MVKNTAAGVVSFAVGLALAAGVIATLERWRRF